MLKRYIATIIPPAEGTLARLLVVADLHFPEYPRVLHRLTRVLGSTRIDALVLAGDFLSSSIEARAESLFRMIRRAYSGAIVAVWGNHEHYLTRNRIRRGWTSLDQLARLRMALDKYDVLILDDTGPVRVEGASLAGVVGWYDYSYGPSGYGREDYERCNPYGVSLDVIERCERRRLDALCPPRWRNDCIYIRLPVSNEEYARLNAEKLERQLGEAEPPVVTVLHHVPRRELIRYTGRSVEDFDMAYAGSPLLGEHINSYSDKVVGAVYGHLHGRSRDRVLVLEGVPYVNAYYSAPGPPGLTLIEVGMSGFKFNLVA